MLFQHVQTLQRVVETIPGFAGFVEKPVENQVHLNKICLELLPVFLRNSVSYATAPYLPRLISPQVRRQSDVPQQSVGNPCYQNGFQRVLHSPCLRDYGVPQTHKLRASRVHNSIASVYWLSTALRESPKTSEANSIPAVPG